MSSRVVQGALFRSLSLLECIRSLGDADVRFGIGCGGVKDRDLFKDDLCPEKVVEEKADRPRRMGRHGSKSLLCRDAKVVKKGWDLREEQGEKVEAKQTEPGVKIRRAMENRMDTHECTSVACDQRGEHSGQKCGSSHGASLIRFTRTRSDSLSCHHVRENGRESISVKRYKDPGFSFTFPLFLFFFILIIPSTLYLPDIPQLFDD